MALVHSFEKQGSTLFKYRGQIPVILFVIAVPVIYFTDYSNISGNLSNLIMYLSILISIVGFIIRAITVGITPKGTSGRNTKEQVADSLNHTGIYSVVRHPLYVGNYLMWIGIVMFTFNIYYVIIVTLAYWLYYERIMFTEEQFLSRKFGDKYIDWSLKVPAFIPSFKNYIKSNMNFSLKAVIRREYSGVLATVIGFVFVDVVRLSFINESFTYHNNHLYILAVTALYALISRSLKHYTNLLNEEGRS